MPARSQNIFKANADPLLRPDEKPEAPDKTVAKEFITKFAMICVVVKLFSS